MRTYLNRLCVGLPAGAVFSIATVNLSSAGPVSARVPAAVYPVRVAPAAQRVIVVYKPVPVMVRQGVGNASASGNGGAGAGSGKGGGGSRGGGRQWGGRGGGGRARGRARRGFSDGRGG